MYTHKAELVRYSKSLLIETTVEKKRKYTFCFLCIWLCRVLVVACGIFQSWHSNSQLWPVGSYSLTQNQTWAPYIGRRESQALDHQKIPPVSLLFEIISAHFYYLFILNHPNFLQCISGELFLTKLQPSNLLFIKFLVPFYGLSNVSIWACIIFQSRKNYF